jgi:LPPG:FO 2-phospho-L-lactate transferase
MTAGPTVLAVCGGVGGAKLALGLQRVLPNGALAVLVNTGDDFRHLGLAISPDLDTVLYTLAGVAHPTRGWGRADESWFFHEELERRGGPDWFRLGDRDLVVHVERTRRLAAGESLRAITAELARRFGVPSPLLPMSDDAIRTMLETEAGVLEFQDYFVRRRCVPRVSAIRYEGAGAAAPNPVALELLASPSLAAVVLCPSNPWLSVDPILAIPGLRRALDSCGVPIVAVSPVIGGRCVKGPTAKLMRELGLEVSARSIARHYADLIDGILIDEEDVALADAIGMPAACTRILMTSLSNRDALAQAVLEFAASLRRITPARRAF